MSGAVALDAIAATVTRWRNARCAAARQTAIAERAERDIIAALGDADTGTIDGEPVVRREVEHRQGFAISEFSTAHPDLVDRFVQHRRREHLKAVRPEGAA